MTAPPTSSVSPATAARRYTIGVVALAGVFAALSLGLNPASLRTTALRLLAIALVGVLVDQGRRWARLLLVVLTGLVAVYAGLLALIRPMPALWRAVFLGYGLGTLWCLWGLFRPPAAAHFQPRGPEGTGGVTQP